MSTDTYFAMVLIITPLLTRHSRQLWTRFVMYYYYHAPIDTALETIMDTIRPKDEVVT
jgi:hypothetical protein